MHFLTIIFFVSLFSGVMGLMPICGQHSTKFPCIKHGFSTLHVGEKSSATNLIEILLPKDMAKRLPLQNYTMMSGSHSISVGSDITEDYFTREEAERWSLNMNFTKSTKNLTLLIMEYTVQNVKLPDEFRSEIVISAESENFMYPLKLFAVGEDSSEATHEAITNEEDSPDPTSLPLTVSDMGKDNQEPDDSDEATTNKEHSPDQTSSPPNKDKYKNLFIASSILNVFFFILCWCYRHTCMKLCCKTVQFLQIAGTYMYSQAPNQDGNQQGAQQAIAPQLNHPYQPVSTRQEI